MVAIFLLVGLRPWRQLIATLPLRVLRRDVAEKRWPLIIYVPIVVLVMVGLLALLLGGIVGWLLLRGLKRLTLRSLSLCLAVNRLLHQPWSTISQLAAFSLSFMLLALMLVLRGDLLSRWQQQLPPDSPNYFLINIALEQVGPLNAFLAENQAIPTDFYPVARA